MVQLFSAFPNFDKGSAGIPKVLMQRTGIKFSLGFLEKIMDCGKRSQDKSSSIRNK